MEQRRRILLSALSLGISFPLALAALARDPAPGGKDGHGPWLGPVIDGSPVHDVGTLWVHAANWGAIGSLPGSGAPYAGAPSAQFPGGSDVEYLFYGGLWVGGIVDGVSRVSTAAYASEFQPLADPRDIVYRTAYGAFGGQRLPSPGADDDWDGRVDEDILDGYDNDGDGLIDEDFAAASDQMMSRVFRDDTPGITDIYPQHVPMHLVVREESYQFSDPGYDDFVGFTLWITNTGNDSIRDAYVGVFADGDVGSRNDRAWEGDMAACQADIPVDHGVHGEQDYDFGYWYDEDGDGGVAPRYGGIVILDHPIDPAGIDAPTAVGASAFAIFTAANGWSESGPPTNDLERYGALATGSIDSATVVPRDYQCLISAGPFAYLAPGETIQFSFALVVTPRGDFSSVQHAAEAYQGLWFDLDGDPNTGIDGKEHQEHWYLPDTSFPLSIVRFVSNTGNGAVHLEWEAWPDENLAGFDLLRAEGSGVLRPITSGTIPADVRTYIDKTVDPGARYDYQLRAYDNNGGVVVSPRVNATVPPGQLALAQNAPNPFAAETTVSFTVPERGNVEISVYDVAGRRVASLFSGEKDAGRYDVQWNGVDDNGERVGAGIYFCRIEAGNTAATRKMVVIR